MREHDVKAVSDHKKRRTNIKYKSETRDNEASRKSVSVEDEIDMNKVNSD